MPLQDANLTPSIGGFGLSHDLPTREYMHRRTREGMSKPEVIRCLKRYVVREIYSALKVSSRMPNFEP